LTDYLLLFAVVLAVNLLPAFGPPTAAILIIFGIDSDLPVAPAVLVAALAAAKGRLLLAHAFRRLGTRVPQRYRSNLEAAGRAFEERPRAKYLAFGMFIFSPLPSAQLFEAAGLTGVRLLPFTLAFFSGRVVSYSLYAFGARSLRTETLGDAFWSTLRSPLGFAIQLAMIAALIILARVDWAALRNNTSDDQV
jgi:uncharacterized membrane protein YdjX (TVP38/TMEM64 family)